MSKPLYVAFVWHMHQPYYKNTISGEYSLPWARLHALKDYLHMAEILAQYPNVHATFNFTPSLLQQLDEYATGEAIDRCLALSLKDSWSPEEKEFMLSFFFNINWDRFIRRYPRYMQLLELRQRAEARADLFDEAYYRDLVAWFNLIWINRNLLEQDEILKGLVEKGRHFTTQDIRAIADKQREIMGRIIPRYRELETTGQIEITTSPYYHPVLPLLMDIRSARQASPRLALPATAFAHPEDAAEQLRRGIDAHESYFGRRPRGLWPPEGAVSQALVSLLANLDGIQWIATDEGILASSLDKRIERDGCGYVTNPDMLYRPYHLQFDTQRRSPSKQSGLQIIFRDVVLSDRIGFTYKHMPSREAAADLVQRLHHIQVSLKNSDTAHLVSIILDGENCWEEYEDNGGPFLHHLYQLLSDDTDLRTVTVSEYLEQYPAKEAIARLATGSWINHNLETWIGQRAQNRAWEYLASTRQWLVSWQRENPLADLRTLEQAWEEIYIAEGSDWFWWYYSLHNPAGENLFDREFRQHLRNVYRLAGVSSPPWLNSPILVDLQDEHQRSVTGYITPSLASEETASEQWARAGYTEQELSAGAMQRSAVGIRRLYYGYDKDNLYFRIESDEDLSSLFTGIYLSLPHASKMNQRPRYAEAPVQMPNIGFHKEIAFRGWTEPVILSRATGQEIWEQQMILPARVNTNVGEVKVPFSALDVQLGDVLSLMLVAAKDGAIIEVLPSSSELRFPLEEFS